MTKPRVYIEFRALRNPRAKALGLAALQIAEAAMDRPSMCSHRGSIYLCGSHPADGAACLTCMRQHRKEHKLLATCDCCDVLADLEQEVLPIGEFVFVLSLCERCKA